MSWSMRVFSATSRDRRSRWGEDLGADCGRYHPCRERAGFEPCVRVASSRVTSFLLPSKRSEVGCPRGGSNPARQNLGEKPIQDAPRSSPHHTLDPIKYCPNAVADPCPPGSWILAPGSFLSLLLEPLHSSPLLDLDLILHLCRRAKSLDETVFAGAGCGYLE